MTAIPTVGAAGPAPASEATPPRAGDHRGSWIPNWRLITTRLMELRKRRGLMIAMIVVIIGIPTIFLVVRLISHAVDPKSYGPAGGYSIYTSLVAGVMYVFGFIMAATLGCTAGSSDLTEGMFRHLVVTGRSRLALYLARIPAGLAIVWSLMAVGFLIVCAVCVFAAPTQLNYDGATVPVGLSQSGLEAWAANHAELVICDFNYNGPEKVGLACGPNGPIPNGPPAVIQTQKGPGAVVGPGFGGGSVKKATPSEIKAAAVMIARQNYADYADTFLTPSSSLMVRSGLWLELEATIGFVVGLGLASLLGQRTVAVILVIVLEIILTPIISTHVIPHFINAERGVVGLATDHLEPAGLPLQFHGGGGGGPGAALLVPESKEVAIIVIVVWLVGWTILGAWRMMTRDA